MREHAYFVLSLWPFVVPMPGYPYSFLVPGIFTPGNVHILHVSNIEVLDPHTWGRGYSGECLPNSSVHTLVTDRILHRNYKSLELRLATLASF